jgi:putative aldouronate transport system permease protein
MFLGLLGLVMLFPFYITLISSVSPPADFGRKIVNLWPSAIDLHSYRSLLGRGSDLLAAYRVTLATVVVGTAMNILATLLAATALANKKLPYRGIITTIIVIPMFFNGGMIPHYLLTRYLGLINNIWVYMAPSLINIYNLLLMRNYIMNIPGEILESASIDGCSDIGAVWHIILPLSTACVATFSLFYAVAHWNDLSTPLLYVADRQIYNLQMYLREILLDARNMIQNPEVLAQLYEPGSGRRPVVESLKAANIMAATLPIIFVYPFIQKFFVKGVVAGSLKG